LSDWASAGVVADGPHQHDAEIEGDHRGKRRIGTDSSNQYAREGRHVLETPSELFGSKTRGRHPFQTEICARRHFVSSEGVLVFEREGAITLPGLFASGWSVGFVGSTAPVDGPAEVGWPVVGPGALTGTSVAASGTCGAAVGPVS
jgi:hypothetical protein